MRPADRCIARQNRQRNRDDHTDRDHYGPVHPAFPHSTAHFLSPFSPLQKHSVDIEPMRIVPRSIGFVVLAGAIRKRVGIGKDDDIPDHLSAPGRQPAPPPCPTPAVFDTLCHSALIFIGTVQDPFMRCHRSL